MLKPLKTAYQTQLYQSLQPEDIYTLSRLKYKPDRIVWLRNHYHLEDETILRTLKHYQLWS